MINRLQGKFSVIDNSVLNNINLSLKAKGLYAFLCSKPNDWDFSYNGLSHQLKEGEKAIRSAVKELVNEKLLLRIPLKDGNNFNGWEWIINPTEEDLEKYIDPSNFKKSEVLVSGTTQNGNYQDGIFQTSNQISNTKNKTLKSNKKEKKEQKKENKPSTTPSNEEKDKTKDFIIKTIKFLKKEDPGIVRYETQYISILSGLISMYSLEEVKEVLGYMYKHSFWKGKLFKPTTIQNNYSAIRQEYFENKKKESGDTSLNNKIILC